MKKIFLIILVFAVSFSGCVAWDEKHTQERPIEKEYSHEIVNITTISDTVEETGNIILGGKKTELKEVPINYTDENILIVDKNFYHSIVTGDHYKITYQKSKSKQIGDFESKTIYYQVKIGEKYEAEFYNDTLLGFSDLKCIKGLHWGV